MQISNSKRSVEITRSRRGEWVVISGRYAATLPATGPEMDSWVYAGEPGEVESVPERVMKLASKVIVREKHRQTEVRREHYRSHDFIELDGQERVRVQVTESRMFAAQRDPVEWTVFCDSRRCREDCGEAVVTRIRREDHWQTEMVTRQVTDAAERAAYDARNDHIAWHRETFGIHPRVELDRWIERAITYQARMGVPEPDRDEIDRQLSIARAEQIGQRAARRSRK